MHGLDHQIKYLFDVGGSLALFGRHTICTLIACIMLSFQIPNLEPKAVFDQFFLDVYRMSFGSSLSSCSTSIISPIGQLK